MNPVALFELLLVLIAVILVLEPVARRLHLPPAAAFILGGIVLALLPGTPSLSLDPGLAMVLFLPPLLLASAYFTSWRDFRTNLRIILQLAVGAVAFTTFVVGVVAHFMVPGLPWAACFALGAIVSPPDAVAAKAILQRVSLPPRMTVLLEGESLVNDASGLVLYRFAVAAALTGTFSTGHALLAFGGLAAGGVLAGAAAGLAVTALFARLDDPVLTIVGSLLAAWGSYIGAEALGVSGVLATVTCGLLMGRRQHHILSAVTRSQGRAVWQVVQFILESLVFLLIGLSLRGVVQRLDPDWTMLAQLLPQVGAVVAAVVLARFAWIVPAVYLPRLIPAVRRRDGVPPFAVPVIMSWAGMRGVVSLAAALALPDGFPGRDFILVATFAVILATVLVQGATLAPLIRLLRLPPGAARPSLSEDEARIHVARAQLAAVERIAGEGEAGQHPRLIEQYGHRVVAAERYHAANGALAGHRAAHFEAILAASRAGREALLRLHREGRVHDTVLHAMEHDLDLEEMIARRLRGEG